MTTTIERGVTGADPSGHRSNGDLDIEVAVAGILNRRPDILPIIDLEENIGVTLCALSYAGQVFLVVTADATGFPDLDVLIAGMEREWADLTTDELVARPPVAATELHKRPFDTRPSA